MINYAQVKNKIPEILEIVNSVPDNLKPLAFEILLKTYVSELQSGKEFSEILMRKQKDKNLENSSKSTKVSKSAAYSIDRQLDLTKTNSRISFKEFVASKNPATTAEFSAVAVYYLIRMSELTSVTLSQAFTCFREVSRRPPEAFKQSFIDTKNRQGWVDFNEDGNLIIPHRGVVLVENDLPSLKRK
jgi:hypothetical protein